MIKSKELSPFAAAKLHRMLCCPQQKTEEKPPKPIPQFIDVGFAKHVYSKQNTPVKNEHENCVELLIPTLP
jgi:hypothetical protein